MKLDQEDYDLLFVEWYVPASPVRRLSPANRLCQVQASPPS